MTSKEHFAAVEATFARAMADRPDDVSEDTYSFAGQTLVVRSVGRELARVLGRPLLRATGAETDSVMRLDVWDGTFGIPMPPADGLRFLHERAGPPGEVLVPLVDGETVLYNSPDLVLWLDRASRHMVGSIRSADGFTDWQLYRPLQAILGTWLKGTGVHVTHAATVALDGAAVMLVGPNGVGKSTSAKACLAAGMDLLGDDVVAVDSKALEAHTLYTVVKVRTTPETIDDTVAQVKDPFGVKEWVTYLNEAAPERLRPTASIAALALPRLSDAKESSFSPAGRGEAMGALLGADQTRDSEEIAAIFEARARLVDQVPAFRLDVGRDQKHLAATVAKIIENAGR